MILNLAFFPSQCFFIRVHHCKSNILKVEKMMYVCCLFGCNMFAVILVLLANKSRQTKTCQNGSNFRGSFSYGQLPFLVIFQNNTSLQTAVTTAPAVCLHVLLHIHLLFIQTRMNYYEMLYYACRLQDFKQQLIVKCFCR